MNKLILFFITLFFILSHIKAQVSNLVWAKSFNSSGAGAAKAITVDAAGNLYTLGSFQDTVDLDPGTGVYTVIQPAGSYISKIDASGNFIWAKYFANHFDAYSIAVDLTGNIYTTGMFMGLADFDPGPGTFILNGLNDIYILKLDDSGNFVWAKGIGSNDNDYGYSIKVDAMNNIYVSGSYGNTVDFDPGPGVYNLSTFLYFGDAFILKLNALGDFVWVKSIGGTAGLDIAYSMALDTIGNIYTTGHYRGVVDFDAGPGTYNLSSTSGGEDVFIAKLDSTGNFVWAKSFGNIDSEFSSGIAVDAGGNAFIAGCFQTANTINPTNTMTISPIGMQDIFVSKLDAAGNFVWVKNIGGSNSMTMGLAFSLAIDNHSNVYTTGYFNQTTDFDPGIGVYNIATTGDQDWDIFISKLDSSGNFVWAGSLGQQDTSYEVGQGITTDLMGNVYVCGCFTDTCDADPGSGIYPLYTQDHNNAFVLKLNNDLQISVSEIKKNSDAIFPYPNPNDGSFNIKLENDIKNGELILIDQLGQLLHSQKINQGLNSIHSNNLAKGIYYYSVLENKISIGSGKIVIE
jgi:hypothetical protein